MRKLKVALKVLGVALPVTLLLAACGASGTTAPSAQPSSSDSLLGRTFVYSDVSLGATDDPPPNGGDGMSITFTNTGLSATGGCNTMSGAADVAHGTLVVTNGLAMTEMGCAAKPMAQDNWFSDLLTSGPTIAVDGDTLTLTTGTTVLTMNDQQSQQSPATLVGPTWNLDTLIEGDTVSSVPQGVTATLTFTADGKVQGQFGCNSGGGSYSVNGDTITFKAIASTLMACMGSKGDVESQVLKVLQGDVTYSIDGQVLTLTQGNQGLSYRTS